MIDSMAPTIRNVDLRAAMQGRNGFTIKVTDDLSGVDTWTATLNGQWILMAYDPKNNALTHTFDDHTNGSWSKEFELEVTDERGNRATWSMNFER